MAKPNYNGAFIQYVLTSLQGKNHRPWGSLLALNCATLGEGNEGKVKISSYPLQCIYSWIPPLPQVCWDFPTGLSISPMVLLSITAKINVLWGVMVQNSYLMMSPLIFSPTVGFFLSSTFFKWVIGKRKEGKWTYI